MLRTLPVLSLMLLAGTVDAAATGDCNALVAPQALPVRPTIVAPVSAELSAPSQQLGAPTGVLAHAYDEAQSVEQVVFRLKLDNCQSVASAMPAVSPAALEAHDPAAYKPRTEFDNAPWRFDMNQNGKRMTAEEFDAWMKSRGVRVAKGAPAAAATVPVAVPATPVSAPAEDGDE